MPPSNQPTTPTRARYARLPLGLLDRLPAGLSRAAGADALLMHLALSTHRRSIPGVLRIGPGALADELADWPPESVPRCLIELEDAGLIRFDRRARLLHVVGLAAADPPRSPSAVTAWARDFLELPPGDVRDGIYAEIDAALTQQGRADEWRRQTESQSDSQSQSQSQPQNQSQSGSQRPSPCTSTSTSTKTSSTASGAGARADETVSDGDDGFRALAEAYPKRRQVDEARPVYARLDLDTTQRANLLEAVQVMSVTDDWTKHQGKYVPPLAVWLERGDWRRVSVTCRSCRQRHAVAADCLPECPDCHQRHRTDLRCARRQIREVEEEEQAAILARAVTAGITPDEAKAQLEAEAAENRAALRAKLTRLSRSA